MRMRGWMNVGAALAALAGAGALAAGECTMTALFDGKSIEGWKIRSGIATYRVEDGAIVGTTVEGSGNTFLCTERDYGDFVLEFEVKCDPALNSGVQIRSHAYDKDTEVTIEGRKRKHAADRVFGYQVEIAANGTAGRVYDEARRGRWLDEPEPSAEAKAAFKPEDWNRYRVIAQGDRIRTFVNGVPVAEVRDGTDATGFIGLQVHGIKKGTGPFSVRWRNIRIRELKPGDEP